MSATTAYTVFRPGESLGRYELIEPLASGGMGTVWVARAHGCSGFARLAAVKTLLRELAEDVQYARALLDEAQLAANSSHPNLCEVIDLGQHRGFPYLVLEWVEGASLSELLAAAPGRGRLEPEQAVAIALGAAAGLHALHESTNDRGEFLGAVHRDVSPQNLLVSVQGTLKVADLGVAKARGQLRARTRSGQVRGKLGYLAPEQVRGARVDRRADVYALGCVMYLCLTGAMPFEASFSAFENVLAGRYPTLDEVRPDLPEPVAAAVRKALAVDPGARFSSMWELRQHLRPWFSGTRRSEQEVLRQCLKDRLGSSLAASGRRLWGLVPGLTSGSLVSGPMAQ